MNAVTKTIEILLRTNAKRTTKYLSDKFVISAQRKTYNNRLLPNQNAEIILKMGKPNYAERDFIRRCKKAGEPFPIKRVQIKEFPIKK